MYKNIEEMARGKLNIVRPVLFCSPSYLDIELVEGTVCSGSFTVSSGSEEPLKGIVYSSDMRMELNSTQFSGTRTQIKFSFRGEYMQEGDHLRGYFQIVSNAGEYQVPYEITVKRLYAESSIGRIDNLEQFIKLYKSNSREAAQVFGTPAFKKILKNNQQLGYYKLLSSRPISMHNLEEFLYAIGEKSRIEFKLNQTEKSYIGIKASVADELFISMNGWGYDELKVSSDADFIRIEETEISTDSFEADIKKLKYVIDVDSLHKGKNFGRIKIENHSNKLVFEIQASAYTNELNDIVFSRRIQKENLMLLDSFVKMRSGEKVLGTWANETSGTIISRIERGEASLFDKMWAAYAYYLNGEKIKAGELLNEFRRSSSANEYQAWSIYLLLSFLDEADEIPKERIRGKIRELYNECPSDNVIRFALIETGESDKETTRQKYDILKKWFAKGCNSSVLYSFVADIFIKEPYLLNELGDFEIQILNWMKKHGMISRDVASQVSRLSLAQNKYNKIFDAILETCYNLFPDTDQLAAICAYKIKGERFSLKDLNWYKLAISYDLKLTGLYEAYINSVDRKEAAKIPEGVLLYFQYTNLLSFRRKALIYANIIMRQAEMPEIYDRFFPIIKAFSQNEIMAGHIDDNLAFCYEHMLKYIDITEDLANALSGIMYTNKFVCQQDEFISVIFMHESFKEPQEYFFNEKEVYLPVCFGGYVILLKSKDGYLYSLDEMCQMARLMNPGKYLRTCIEKAPECIPYILHHMSGKTGILGMDDKMAGYVRILVDSNEISDDYKSQIGPGFLKYLKNNEPLLNTRRYLLEIDYGKLDNVSRSQYLESLADLNMFEEAWTFILSYGAGDIGVDSLSKILAFEIDRCEATGDDNLVYLALRCFELGTNERKVVKYLLQYFSGDADTMEKIYKKACELGLRSNDFEEKMLILIAFSGKFVDSTEAVFVDLMKNRTKDLIRKAYFNYFSDRAYIGKVKASDEFYFIMENSIKQGIKVNDICLLALMEHFCGMDVISSERVEIIDNALTTFISRGLYFEVFLNLPCELLARHHLYDLGIASYKSASPNSVVSVYYRHSSYEEFKPGKLKKCGDIYVFRMRMSPTEKTEYYFVEHTTRSVNYTSSCELKIAEGAGLLNNRFTEIKALSSGEVKSEDARGIVKKLIARNDMLDKYLKTF